MSGPLRFTVTRLLGELSPGAVLAPERYLARDPEARAGDAEPSSFTLEGEVVERREALAVADLVGALVFDTTHARDGLLDVAAAARTSEHPPASVKKRFYPGDLLVSRLRPYLRQVAFASPAAFGEVQEPPRVLACSTEFFVLAPRAPRRSLAHLLPWLLSAPVQAALASAQEGGHHPRVPREVLLGLAAPGDPQERAARSRQVARALEAFYRAREAYQQVLTASSAGAPGPPVAPPRGPRGPAAPRR